MTTQLKRLLYLLIWCFILACSGDLTKPNKVVLIFEDWSEEDPFVDQVSRVTYVDDYLIPHVFKPGERERAKHVISTSREYIDVAMESGAPMTRHFLLRNGDSVLVKLSGQWPVITILNRQVTDYESNFESSKQQDLYGDNPSALEDYYYYWSRANGDISPISGTVISEELHFMKEKAFKEIDRESIYIDSLHNGKVIGDEIALFYQRKNAYLRDRLRLFEIERINFSNAEIIGSILSNINRKSEDSSDHISTFHDDFITVYYHGFLSEQLDNERRLDSLIEAGYFSTAFGQSLLFKHLDKLLMTLSVEEGKKLLESRDDHLLSKYVSIYFHSKHNLDQEFDRHWIISGDRRDALTFDQLLLENQGKLLYIDFWASWCTKSIQEIPALEKLYRDYPSGQVNIVHISVDKEPEKWKWAEDKYLGFNPWNSFVIRDIDVATISETFTMSAIPRYMLFDQNGNLIHGNAPRPGSEQIRVLLDKYLGKPRNGEARSLQ
jgi:thiol-disulfide isomerase/thioredoxin